MPPRRKDIAVILVHYHTPELLIQAVDALQQDFKDSKLNGEIVIVDNGSEAADFERLSSLPAAYVKSERNLGYASGINRGAMFTTAEYMVFMNPDVLVQPGCLAALVRELRSGAHAVGPKFFWDGQLKYLLPPNEKRSRFNRLLYTFASWGETPCRIARGAWRRHAHRHWNAKKPIRSYELSGALLAVTREAWNKIGPMDESFRLYFEETDWLLRLLRAGFEAKYVPDAHAVHAYNQSARAEPMASKWFAESQTLFERRYYGERFCRFLSWVSSHRLAARTNPVPVRPDIPALNLSLASGILSKPKWFELSIVPYGFPATVCQISKAESGGTWHVPQYLYQQLSAGVWEVRTVNQFGSEALATRFATRAGVLEEENQEYEQRRVSPLS